jgi:flagellar biosynthesis protein
MVDLTDIPEPATPKATANRQAVAVAVNAAHGATPKVTAAGRGELAEQILALAFAKGIKVREDADLAEMLAALELDTPIPGEAIIAVAEILAKVYEANHRLQSAPETSDIQEPHG